jgi:pimeloyl-ACP methyl ester carboxylesterase
VFEHHCPLVVRHGEGEVRSRWHQLEQERRHDVIVPGRAMMRSVTSETSVDETTGRKFFLDHPTDEGRGDLTFVLSLHGGGSVGMWQRLYFPAHDFVDDLGLVVATPSSATKQPMSHWVHEADDEHLRAIVEQVQKRFGGRLRTFWLAGHSQGGMTSRRLLTKDPFFAERVDGWLSLSGGRLGQAPFVADFGPPRTPEEREAMQAFMARRRSEMSDALPDADFSHIFAVGEHEIVELPETSPWAERYGAGARVRDADVVDTEPGQVHDGRFEGRYVQSWGREPRAGTANVWTYPGARDGRVIADAVRLDKGHTEGLEPNITRRLLELMVSAPPT